VPSGGHDEQGQALAVVGRRDEDEAVRDLGRRDAQGVGGGLRGAHGIGEVAHLRTETVLGQGLHHRAHTGVLGEVSRGVLLARRLGHGGSVATR
jgi:hypothetical protein